MQHALPDSHLPYTDKYFIHARKILAAEGLNPRVTMQVFIRRGPARVFGVDEAVAILGKYTTLEEHGGRVLALPEGSEFAPAEPLMHIEGPIQDFIELETMYLGVLSARTTEAADKRSVSPEAVGRHAAAIREAAPGKFIMYFGARHWHWSMDAAITKAVIEAGFDATSTDIGARSAGLEQGVGTIPHALVLAFAHAHGRERATLEATRAFHRHIEAGVPRIALVDTFSREIDDAVATAKALGGALDAVRLDTAGEVIAQGGAPFDGRTFITGPGVTVTSTLAVRKALDAAGFEDVNIVLSSGFGKLDKLRTFVQAEREHGRLFESLGIGGVFEARFATADIVQVEGRDLAKCGRAFRENPRLVRML